MKHYTVVAAVIEDNEQVLCMQRKESKYDYVSYKYEFPGGKVEAGETPENALVREILEELDLSINIKGPYLTVNHQYPDFSLTMHSFLCKATSRTPQLKEHIKYQWLNRDELGDLDWAAADIPIVEKLQSEAV
jgi:8-oxo-dGTP diphosphatase